MIVDCHIPRRPLGYARRPLGYARRPLGYARRPLGYARGLELTTHMWPLQILPQLLDWLPVKFPAREHNRSRKPLNEYPVLVRVWHYLGPHDFQIFIKGFTKDPRINPVRVVTVCHSLPNVVSCRSIVSYHINSSLGVFGLINTNLFGSFPNNLCKLTCNSGVLFSCVMSAWLC